jgi:uncharacterized protein YcbK (DUF882 family)
VNKILNSAEVYATAIFSKTAMEKNIDNRPDHDQCKNIEQMYINIVKPINELFSGYMKITSWFRNEEVNKLVGGHENSRHKIGLAVDFYINDKERNVEKVFKIIKKNLNISFYKLILYKKRGFIHISYSFEPSELLKRITKIK